MPIRVSSKRAPAPAQQVPFGLPKPPPNYAQKPAGLSLCMIVKNEERFLEQCLRSVADVADEICIVDTGSTDATLEIAERFGAKIAQREWRNDFAWARNASLELATKRWIIMLDADEELTADSKAALAALKSAPAHHTGLWVRCYNQSDDYAGTGAMSHALVRVFPNSERIRFRGMIHEFVALDNSNEGIAATIAPVSIVHHGYLKEVVESRGKARRNYEIVCAAAEADPSDPFAWFNVGSTAFMMGDFEHSRDAFERMRELNGKAPRGFIANGYAILAETYSDKLGDPVKGEQIAREALEFSPRYANAHFQLGKTLIAQKRFDDARAAFLEAIEDGKYAGQQFVVDDQVYIWKSHSEIGSTYVMQGDDASAIEWFRKGLANAPKVQPLRLNLARALERSGAQEEARELFGAVYDEFRDASSCVEFVNYLLRQNDGAAALSVIDEMHQKLADETAVPLLEAAAQICVKIGRDPAAYLEIAAARAPGNADVLNWLEALYRERGDDARIGELREREDATEAALPAQCLRRSYNANVAGDFAAGLAFAQRGLQADPAHEHLHYNAAVSCAALGRLDEALMHLDESGSSESPVFVPGQILRANCLRKLQRVDDAIGAIEAVLARDPVHVEALVIRAELFETLGDVAAAERSLRQIMDADPQQDAAHVATFLLRHGRFEEAVAVADGALQR